jgi:hypothetical protein
MSGARSAPGPTARRAGAAGDRRGGRNPEREKENDYENEERERGTSGERGWSGPREHPEEEGNTKLQPPSSREFSRGRKRTRNENEEGERWGGEGRGMTKDQGPMTNRQ